MGIIERKKDIRISNGNAVGKKREKRTRSKNHEKNNDGKKVNKKEETIPDQ